MAVRLSPSRSTYEVTASSRMIGNCCRASAAAFNRARRPERACTCSWAPRSESARRGSPRSGRRSLPRTEVFVSCGCAAANADPRSNLQITTDVRARPAVRRSVWP